MIPDYKTIGKHIRIARKCQFLSQENMAEDLNITQNAYCKIELGQTALTVERLMQIAKLLEVDYVKILKDAEQDYALSKPKRKK